MLGDAMPEDTAVLVSVAETDGASIVEEDAAHSGSSATSYRAAGPQAPIEQCFGREGAPFGQSWSASATNRL